MKRESYLVRHVWLASFIFIFVILGGCASQQSASPAFSPTSAPTQPATIQILGDASIVPFNTPQRMCHATLVADVTVSALMPAHWNTPDHSGPSTTDPYSIRQQGYAIYTPIQFSHMALHVDHRKGQVGEFVLYGGQTGPYLFDVGFPKVTPGMRYILTFIPGYDVHAHAYTLKWLLVNDAFPIDAHDIVTLQPQVTEPDGTTPAVTMPLAQLTQQLTACP